ncbi:MAG: YajQ family cyclic di-GMP-binding protein [Campylobacterales bacterium]
MAAKEHSFDISAEVNMQEVKNALETAKKEIANRYDFKGVLVEMELNEKNKTITLISSGDYQINAMFDTLLTKALRRNLSEYTLKRGQIQEASGGNKKMVVSIVDTLDQESAKKIIKAIKESKLKVQATIQGDQIRVSAKSIDDLQATIALVKGLGLELPLTYGNFR